MTTQQDAGTPNVSETSRTEQSRYYDGLNFIRHAFLAARKRGVERHRYLILGQRQVLQMLECLVNYKPYWGIHHHNVTPQNVNGSQMFGVTLITVSLPDYLEVKGGPHLTPQDIAAGRTMPPTVEDWATCKCGQSSWRWQVVDGEEEQFRLFCSSCGTAIRDVLQVTTPPAKGEG